MKTTIICAFLTVSAFWPIFAQNATLSKNNQWLEKTLNTYVTTDKDDNDKDGGKETKPTFKFAGCRMAMDVKAEEENFAMGINMSWLLKDIRKVNYKKEKDGTYTLLLDVPTEKVNMDMGFGGNSSVSFKTSNTDKNKNDNDNSNKTSFSLTTKDEKLVQEMVRRFESSIGECKAP